MYVLFPRRLVIVEQDLYEKNVKTSEQGRSNTYNFDMKYEISTTRSGDSAAASFSGTMDESEARVRLEMFQLTELNVLKLEKSPQEVFFLVEIRFHWA